MSNVNDNVNHPSHYCQEGSMECIDEMIMIFGKEEDMKKSDWYLAKYKELKESVSIACTSSGRCSPWS